MTHKWHRMYVPPALSHGLEPCPSLSRIKIHPVYCGDRIALPAEHFMVCYGCGCGYGCSPFNSDKTTHIMPSITRLLKATTIVSEPIPNVEGSFPSFPQLFARSTIYLVLGGGNLSGPSGEI